MTGHGSSNASTRARTRASSIHPSFVRFARARDRTRAMASIRAGVACGRSGPMTGGRGDANRARWSATRTTRRRPGRWALRRGGREETTSRASSSTRASSSSSSSSPSRVWTRPNPSSLVVVVVVVCRRSRRIVSPCGFSQLFAHTCVSLTDHDPSRRGGTCGDGMKTTRALFVHTRCRVDRPARATTRTTPTTPTTSARDGATREERAR